MLAGQVAPDLPVTTDVVSVSPALLLRLVVVLWGFLDSFDDKAPEPTAI